VPKVSGTYLEVRREQILNAAIACFAHCGFHQTTMADIAREAGVSPGAIYRYFASKEDIIEASAEARRRARIARFQEARQASTGLQALQTLMDRYVERMDQRETLLLLTVQLYGEALSNARVRTSVRAMWNDVQVRLEDVVRSAQARGDIDGTLDPRATALLLMAVTEGLNLHKSVDPTIDLWKTVELFKVLFGFVVQPGLGSDADS
jgi:AcrR family transcriptional regulator